MTLLGMMDDEDLEIRIRAYEALRDRRSALILTVPIEGKFGLDIVQAAHRTIYVTQSHKPRIAVLGGDLEVERPIALQSLGGQLLIRADEERDGLAIRYQSDDMPRARILRCSAKVSDLVQSLAWEPVLSTDPEGLNLSYGETVSVLHDLWKAGYLAGDFKAEQDRVLAELQRWGTLSDYEQRPDIRPSTAREAPAPAKASNEPAQAG